MKKITLVTLVTLSAVVFGATQASAEEVVAGQGKETKTEIKVVDNNDGSGTDPLNPKDPTQTMLLLTEVPSNFDFSTKLSNKTYEITSGASTGNIVVFNDRIDRDWSVKATLKDNKIYNGQNDTVGLDVTSFMVNGSDITKTGQAPVAKAVADNRTKDNNAGEISTAVTGLSIKFNDTENTLKINDTLTGTVNYSLYNTMNAQ